ncbi:MAG: hypothetical protein HFJ55_01850 [Clostridia bacterium]|nr:hypothetical protein [Clostridia bacterium]
MLVPILLSLLWAICSTVLVLPWFWHGLIKRKTIIGDEKYRGVRNTEKNELKSAIILQIVYACISLAISLFMYLVIIVRHNFYGSIISILFVLLFQFFTMLEGWNSKRKEKSLIILAVAVVCLFFSLTDSITSNFNVIGLSKANEEIPIFVSSIEQEKEVEKTVLSGSTVAGLFKATGVSGPEYSNGKFVYTVTKSPNGYGIVIIDEKAGETARFIACDFEFQMSLNLRERYPFARVKELNVVISDDNIPFGKYAILSKPNLFGAPVLEKYVLQNMLTGDFTEYTAEELPKFAE